MVMSHILPFYLTDQKLLSHLAVLVFSNWINWHKSLTTACIFNSVALHAKNTLNVQFNLV